MIKEPKNILYCALSLFLVFAILFGIYLMFLLPRFSKPFVSGRTISVSGSGKVFAAPDIAKISFSVITQGKKALGVFRWAIAETNNAINLMKTEGVSESDIQTTNYNIYPNYVYDKYTQTQIIDSYTFNQTVSVKVRDLSKVAEILGKLSSLGVSQLTGPDFSLSDTSQAKFLIDAESQAFANAQSKAESMAKANGIKLGNIINLSESSSPYPVYRGMMNASVAGGSSAPSPTIETGTNEVDASVSITYEIDD
jgi:uncharacterized protein YggE